MTAILFHMLGLRALLGTSCIDDALAEFAFAPMGCASAYLIPTVPRPVADMSFIMVDAGRQLHINIPSPSMAIGGSLPLTGYAWLGLAPASLAPTESCSTRAAGTHVGT